jgi:hypothetical protein
MKPKKTDIDILTRRCKYCNSPMHWTQSDDGCDTCLKIRIFVRKYPLAIQKIMEEYRRSTNS